MLHACVYASCHQILARCVQWFRDIYNTACAAQVTSTNAISYASGMMHSVAGLRTSAAIFGLETTSVTSMYRGMLRYATPW